MTENDHDNNLQGAYPETTMLHPQSPEDFQFKRWLVDSGDVMENLRQNLRGYYFSTGQDVNGNNAFGWVQEGEPLADDQTISKIVTYIGNICSRDVRQAQYKPARALELTRQAMRDFIVWLAIEKARKRIKFANLKYITSITKHYIEASFSRAIGGRERNLLHEHRTRAENVFSSMKPAKERASEGWKKEQKGES